MQKKEKMLGRIEKGARPDKRKRAEAGDAGNKKKAMTSSRPAAQVRGPGRRTSACVMVVGETDDGFIDFLSSLFHGQTGGGAGKQQQQQPEEEEEPVMAAKGQSTSEEGGGGSRPPTQQQQQQQRDKSTSPKSQGNETRGTGKSSSNTAPSTGGGGESGGRRVAITTSASQQRDPPEVSAKKHESAQAAIEKVKEDYVHYQALLTSAASQEMPKKEQFDTWGKKVRGDVFC